MFSFYKNIFIVYIHLYLKCMKSSRFCINCESSQIFLFIFFSFCVCVYILLLYLTMEWFRLLFVTCANRCFLFLLENAFYPDDLNNSKSHIMAANDMRFSICIVFYVWMMIKLIKEEKKKEKENKKRESLLNELNVC